MQNKQFSNSKRLKIQLTISREEDTSTPLHGVDAYESTQGLSSADTDIIEAVVHENLLLENRVASLNSSIEENVVGDIINTLLEF